MERKEKIKEKERERERKIENYINLANRIDLTNLTIINSNPTQI